MVLCHRWAVFLSCPTISRSLSTTSIQLVFLCPDCLMSIISCLQHVLLTCPNHSNSLSITVSYIHHSDCFLYSFFTLSSHTSFSTSSFHLHLISSPACSPRPAKSSDKAEDLPLFGHFFLNLPLSRFVLKFFRFFLTIRVTANKIDIHMKVLLFLYQFRYFCAVWWCQNGKIGSFCVTGRSNIAKFS